MVKKSVVEQSYFSPSELDIQEHLSLERLKELNTHTIELDNTYRPKDSFIELISWVNENFAKALNPSSRLNRLVHNKIIIDGQFLQFCNEQNVEITSLHNDSVVSWKSEHGNEKFFAQGVFLIKGRGMKFIHSALYHKGNQNEDELSLFILVDNENYNSYISFRNKYDEWSIKRDRSNLQIRVVDGDDIPYERDSKWDEIYLPEELKNNIKLSVEGFLKSKEIYESKKIPWKRGILLWGNPGNGKTSLIKTIISNYDFKPVTVLPSANDDSMREAFAYAQEQNPALLYFEDLDSLLQNINISLFLNLLDGISTKNGLLIVATANNLENLKANIKDRPSRFDRKFEIPMPSAEMSLKYLKKWFGNSSISEKEYQELNHLIVKHKFSYAYIKELYISSVYNAIANDSTGKFDKKCNPTKNDINLALKQLIDDKFKIDGRGTVGIDKYIDIKK